MTTTTFHRTTLRTLSVLTTLALAACGAPDTTGDVALIQGAAKDPPPGDHAPLERPPEGPKVAYTTCGQHASGLPDATLEVDAIEAGPVTVSVPPRLAYNPKEAFDSCPRWVVDVVFPANRRLGCLPGQACYEILAGADNAPSWNATQNEDHFYVPDDDVTPEYCESYVRNVEVYAKLAGETAFHFLDSYLYRGYWQGSWCQVIDYTHGYTNDASEVFTTAVQPSSDENVYRIAQAARVDGYYRGVMVSAEQY